VIPWRTLGRARAPGGGELVLAARGEEFVIRVDGAELMSSRAHASEERLAEAALAGARPDARVLIGGLGMGFTLRAALDRLGAGAEAIVAEIVPEVVEWNRGALAAVAGRPLEDPRVEVIVGDVGRVIREATVRFDAILLDVDNGPAALTRRGNQGLYGEPGLVAARRALRVDGGVLAVWSAGREAEFGRRMRRAGFEVTVVEVAARGERGGARHVVYVGRTTGGGLRR
jgi:spermidine synthase